MDIDGALHIGKIVGVHGMKGYLKVFSSAESTGPFEPGKHLTMKRPDGEMQTVKVVASQTYKKLLRIAFEDITDRSAAETLIGGELYIDRSELPEPEEGSWYWCDLIGLEVYGVDDTYLGRIENVFATGSNDVIVVKNGKTEILIPVIESIIYSVDLEGKKVTVDLPEGL
jgi:16S rRNA processing protein RimM